MNKVEESPVDWGTVENAHKYTVKALPINKDNKLIYLIAVGVLGFSIVVSTIAMSVLAYYGKEIPSSLVAISSVAIGALGGLFTRN